MPFAFSQQVPMHLLKSAAITLFIFAAACADSEQQQELLGLWGTGCLASETSSDYFIMSWQFSADRLILDSQGFTDANCTTEKIRQKISGSYSTGEAVLLSSGKHATALDIHINNDLVTIYDESLVSLYNNLSLCGVSNWSAGLEVSIDSCVDLDIPRDIFTIYSVSSQTLYLGEASSTSAEQRPVTLSQIAFVKQE